MVDTTGRRSQRNLFLAFKAAAIVFSKIKTDVQDILEVLNGPATGWPPPVTSEMVRFPTITRIDAESNAFTKPQPEKIQFSLES